MRRADRHLRMLVGAGEIDVDQDRLARLAVDQEIPYDPQLASTDRANLPATDVRFTLRDLPGVQRAEGHEPLTLSRVWSNAGGVTAFTISVHFESSLSPTASTRRSRSTRRRQRLPRG